MCVFVLCSFSYFIFKLLYVLRLRVRTVADPGGSPGAREPLPGTVN